MTEHEKLILIKARAKDLLSTYIFKMSGVVDARQRLVPLENAIQMHQLERALREDI